MRRTSWSFVILLTIFGKPSFAHDANNHVFQIDDPGFVIVSDFGPRLVTTGSLFHKAIDFRRAVGQTTPLLLDGVVSDLSRRTGNILSFTVNGTQNSVTHRLRYFHMFNAIDELVEPVCLGGFMLTTHDGSVIGDDDARAIVKITPGTTNRADYILSRNPGETVTVDFNATPSTTCTGFSGSYTFQTQATVQGVPQFDQNGNPVLVNAVTIDTINRADHPSVGPSGDSGSPGRPHMHIEMAPAGTGFVNVAYSENPLFHMPDRATQYKVRSLNIDSTPRLSGYVVGSKDSDSSFLRIELDGGTTQVASTRDGAFDLEEVNLYVDQAVDANRVRQFKMGGNTEADDRINLSDAEIDTDAVERDTDGMRPLRDPNNANSGMVGLERYVYTGWESAGTTVSPSNLTDGEHTLIIKLTDIHTNELQNSIKFNIDNTAPTSSLTVTQN